MALRKQKKFFNRELSWLSFNYRVLQESKNEAVPLIERLKFLAIYSSNLDEFYRVRVASHRSLINIKQSDKKVLLKEKELIKRINKLVRKQQKEFGKIYSKQLIPELRQHKIFILDETMLSKNQQVFALDYFKQYIQSNIKIKKLDNHSPLFLENKGIYFAIKLNMDNPEYMLTNIPSHKLGRFLILPDTKSQLSVIFIDDIIRLGLPILFPNNDIIACHSIKLSRDADLYIEDEFSGILLEKIKKSLNKRHTNIPARLLYDSAMTKSFLKFLTKKIELKNDDLIPGGRYHNFDDFFSFPNPEDKSLLYPEYKPLNHNVLEGTKSYFDAISKGDYMLHFPYHNYKYVINFIKQVAKDPKVTTIKITLYRVASNSLITKALLQACKQGKEVIVFDEVKARFDEKKNIYWGNKLLKAGAKVIYSLPDLKVHSKICLIEREEDKSIKKYAYLATGNFNEKTAQVYCDHGLFTSNKDLCNETEKVFNFLINIRLRPRFKHLLVAPFSMRKRFVDLIDNEIKNAQDGKKASMILKMNSLEDKNMIRKLYEASNTGVKIKIIVRGICCLIPGVEGMSKNIKVISIVDRFLEHGRVYIFHNNGDEKIYLASADWMTRNLNRRVEVGFPILDETLKTEIKKIINFQLRDNVKARILNKTQSNPYKKATGKKIIQAQQDTYDFLKKQIKI